MYSRRARGILNRAVAVIIKKLLRTVYAAVCVHAKAPLLSIRGSCILYLHERGYIIDDGQQRLKSQRQQYEVNNIYGGLY
mmetsp:Transcript_34891/g.48565  ORF Transcript_34891/g.48565 Transcript_34891/m.48565 type:complete len:80 (+) Transcript_34891:294-533(+)